MARPIVYVFYYILSGSSCGTDNWSVAASTWQDPRTAEVWQRFVLCVPRLPSLAPYGVFWNVLSGSALHWEHKWKVRPANNGKLTPAQSQAARTLLAREAQYGTTIAAFKSAIGFGD